MRFQGSKLNIQNEKQLLQEGAIPEHADLVTHQGSNTAIDDELLFGTIDCSCRQFDRSLRDVKPYDSFLRVAGHSQNCITIIKKNIREKGRQHL
jgi:hypothetical protein